MKRAVKIFVAGLLAVVALATLVSTSFESRTVPPAKSHERLIGLAVAPSSQEYGESLMDSFEAGSVVYEISQQWKESGSKDNTAILRVLASLMKQQNIPIVLTLNPLDTTENQIPEDLKDKPFDDAEFLARYKEFVDATLAELKGVAIRSIAVGNEVDVLLGDDAARWNEYAVFFRNAKDYLKTACPDAKLGVKFTYDGLTTKRGLATPIVRDSDCVMMTYYPVGDTAVRSVDVVERELKGILDAFPNQNLHINELGYPYSSKLSSSRNAQAEFVVSAFTVFDANPRIELMNFVWLNDMPPAMAKQLAQAMGGGAMGEFLTTLGLRDHKGKPGPAFEAFRREAKSRGYLPK